MKREQQQTRYVKCSEALRDFFRGYRDFNGRTTRAGFWWVQSVIGLMAVLIVGMVVQIVWSLIKGPTQIRSVRQGIDQLIVVTEGMLPVVLVGVVLLLIGVVPMIALHVRRYRDVGFRGRGLVATLLISTALSFMQIPYVSWFAPYIVALFLLWLTMAPSNYIGLRKKDEIMEFFFHKREE